MRRGDEGEEIGRGRGRKRDVERGDEREGVGEKKEKRKWDVGRGDEGEEIGRGERGIWGE